MRGMVSSAGHFEYSGQLEAIIGRYREISRGLGQSKIRKTFERCYRSPTVMSDPSG